MQSLGRIVSVALIVSLGCGVALADGKGKGGGLARALSKAGGKGSANSALSRAGQNLSRAGGGLSRAGLGKAGGPKAEPLAAAIDPATRHQKQLLIEQRNRDQRLAQAEHLRQIAARNGDSELAANAERMAAFAEQHYQERVAHLARFGVVDPALNPAPSPQPEFPPVTPEPLPQP